MGVRTGGGFGRRPRLFGRAGDAKAQKEKTEAFAQRVKQVHGLVPFLFCDSHPSRKNKDEHPTDEDLSVGTPLRRE
jgi:hypothetical protein